MPGAGFRAVDGDERRRQNRPRRFESGRDLESGTIVVVPSITYPAEELRKITGAERYEERLLCLSLLLAKPDVHIIYATSLPIDESVADYYVSFTGDPSARRRLTLVSPERHGLEPLTAKLLDHPDSIERIRAAIGGSDDAYLLPFNVTELELRLSQVLDIPLYGPRPDLVPLGSKSGSRRVARAAGVPVLEGAEELRSQQEVEAAIDELKAKRPGAEAAVVKLNQGFSGQGNAIIELTGWDGSLQRARISFCATEESLESYGPKIARDGAIVEELVRGDGMSSPSAQLRISPAGEVIMISTHDQVLGGADQHVYLGCRFPAIPEYRFEIQQLGRKIGEVLRDNGVVGTFGIDFIVAPGDDGYDIYLSEINLRLGGTTHPFATARLVTGGRYDQNSGELIAGGRPKFYVATDNLKSERYVGLSPARAIDALQRQGIAFDRRRQRGAVLHLLGALEPYGKLGATCIGDSLEEASEISLALSECLDSVTT